MDIVVVGSPITNGLSDAYAAGVLGLPVRLPSLGTAADYVVLWGCARRYTYFASPTIEFFFSYQLDPLWMSTRGLKP